MAYTVFRATVDNIELARTALAEIHERRLPDDVAIHAFLADPASYLLLAIENGHVVGSLNGYALRQPDRSRPQFLLYEIDVRQQNRRRGIGQALVNAFTDEARTANAFEVWVVSNESTSAALAMYRTCGYRRENDDDVMLSIPL